MPTSDSTLQQDSQGGMSFAFVVVVAAVTLLAAACGSSTSSPSPPPAAPTRATDDPPVVITAKDPLYLVGLAAAAVNRHRLPAFAIAHVSDDASVTVGIAGRRSHGSDVKLGDGAPFHLGSDTKAMTAVLLATFVGDGLLDLDSSLGDLFGELQLDGTTSAATLRDVLGHRAGLDDSTLNLESLYAATDSSRARAEAVTAALVQPTGTFGAFAYANVNYMLAGVVAERIGNDTWEHLITKRVFAPLGMSCGFGAPRGPSAPLGHTSAGQPIPDDAPEADNPATLGPAGTVNCTMADWAKFATAVLAGLRGKDSPVLSAATAADLFADDHDYVAGWGKLQGKGQTIYTHDGSNTLWYARAILLVERNEALLMASNTGERGAVDAMDEVGETILGD